MRKTLLTIFAAMLTTVSTSAADISLQSAKTLAAQYVTVPQVQRAKSNTSGSTTNKLLNHFYCFNDASGKGFVLISDDDCVQPVLGYSDSGAFDVDHVPVQLQDWLTAVSQYISKNKAAGKTVAALKVMTPNGSHWIRIIPVFFITSDIPTGISVPSVTESTGSDDNAPYYTLQGIRLSARPTSPGLYIRKGKAVVVK